MPIFVLQKVGNILGMAVIPGAPVPAVFWPIPDMPAHRYQVSLLQVLDQPLAVGGPGRRFFGTCTPQTRLLSLALEMNRGHMPAKRVHVM